MLQRPSSSQQRGQETKAKLLFRSLVKRVLWRSRGDFLQNIKSHFLDNGKLLEGYHDEINPLAEYTFRQFSNSLKDLKRLKYLDLSGSTINAYFAIELSEVLKVNTSIQVLSLANCNLSSFSLSCLFQAISNNKTLKSINLMNNQSFNEDTVQDFCDYILRGRTCLEVLGLTHCNIQSYLLTIIFRNLRHLNTLKVLKLNLMDLNAEGIIALRSALIHYNGKKMLEYLDISFDYIGDEGIVLLNNILKFSYRSINLEGLDLSRNGFTQFSIVSLEQLLLKIKNLKILNLSNNSIKEFQSQKFLRLNLLKLNLSRNLFRDFPLNFMLQVKHIDLSSNSILTQGAYQLSQILSNTSNQWQTLNLNDNYIMPDGFISIIYALVKFNKNLINLYVANNQVDGHGVLYLASNHEQLNLQCIDISRNPFRYQLVYAILQMMKDCSIELINLSQIQFQKDELNIINEKELQFELKASNLKQLNFSGNPQMALPVVRSLSKNFVRLEAIDLSSCRLYSNYAMYYLTKLLQRTQALLRLNLANNDLGRVDGEPQRQFLEALQIQLCLQYLNLSKNKYGLSIKYLLMSIKSISSLQEVDLSENMIDDKSQRWFDLFIQSTHIQVLHLGRNFIGKLYLSALMNSQVRILNLNNNRLAGHHLLMLSKVMYRDQILSLDLNSNIHLDQIRSFFYLKEIPVIKNMRINNVQFTQSTFNIFLKSIKENKSNIESIEILNTMMDQKELNLFFMSVGTITRLKSLQLQYLALKDSKVVQTIEQNMFERMRRLQYVGLHQCLLSPDLWVMLIKMHDQGCQLKCLDLSGTFLDNFAFNCVIQILVKTSTLEQLVLSNCNINDETLKDFPRILSQNYSIKILDLSRNQLSFSTIIKLLNIENTLKEQKLLSMRFSHIGLFTEDQLGEQRNTTGPQALQIFDISENVFTEPIMHGLVKCLVNSKTFPHLKQVNLSGSFINNQLCLHIQILIQQSQNIVDLDLSNNQIGDQGFEIISQSLQTRVSKLKYLNIQKNVIGNEFFIRLCNYILYPSLRLLNISQNKVDGQSCMALTILLQNNPDLYIYNFWTGISEELAFLIVNSQFKLNNSFSLKSDNIPNFLRFFYIENSELTDKFCIYFGQKFYELPYIEVLSFSNNPHITKYGKIYLYLTIAQSCYQDFKLNQFYFNEERNFPTLFDDGILGYMLMKIKQWVLDDKEISITSLSSAKYEQIIPVPRRQNGKFGFIGKVIIAIINRSIQDKEQHITFSSKLLNQVIKYQQRFKIYAISHIIGRLFIIALSFRLYIGLLDTATWRLYVPIYRHDCQQQIDQGKSICVLNIGNSRIDTLIWTFLYTFGISFVMVTFDLMLAIQIRRNADPDFKLLSPSTINYLQRKLPHKDELVLYIFTILVSMNYFFAINLSYNSYKLKQTVEQILEDQLDITNRDPYLKIISQSYGCFVTINLLVIVNFFQQHFCEYKALKILFTSKPETERVDYLNAFMALCQHSHNYVLQTFLSYFCPQQGVHIWKMFFNFRALFELLEFVTLELPQLIIHIVFLDAYFDLYYLQIGVMTIQIRGIFIYLGLLKCFVKAALNIYFGLTIKHPKIKEQEFNQLLFLRNFYKNKQQFHLDFKDQNPFDTSIQSPINHTPPVTKVTTQKKKVQFSNDLMNTSLYLESHPSLRKLQEINDAPSETEIERKESNIRHLSQFALKRKSE